MPNNNIKVEQELSAQAVRNAQTPDGLIDVALRIILLATEWSAIRKNEEDKEEADQETNL